MSNVFRFKENQPICWYHKQKTKSNQYCLYCGMLVGKESSVPSNKEHLIGREFVPSGAFGDGKCFNFIFRACKKCNDEKSDIERHISSVSLFSSPARSEEIYNRIAENKGNKDFHPDKQRTLVKDSGDNFSISTDQSHFKMTIDMSGPPQPNHEFMKMLAFRHIQGFFSLITSKNPLVQEGTNLLAGKYFYFYNMFIHDDWGNQHMMAIMDRAKEIPCYANIDTANGFFKIMMRRAENQDEGWFWALEWNNNYRLVGAIGKPDEIPYIFRDLPNFKYIDLGIRDGVRTRMRENISLSAADDILFKTN